MTKQQFIELIAAEQESLRRFLRGLCSGDGFKADDIAQETLLKAYLSYERFEGRARFSTWLFRIAYNCWYDHVRKYGREGGWLSLEEPDSCPVAKIEDVGAEADRKYEHQQLYMAIKNLTAHEQAVILLFYMEEKSIKEIMDIMEMPSGTVRSCLTRGRQHLKQYLEKNV